MDNEQLLLDKIIKMYYILHSQCPSTPRACLINTGKMDHYNFFSKLYYWSNTTSLISDCDGRRFANGPNIPKHIYCRQYGTMRNQYKHLTQILIDMHNIWEKLFE